MALRHVGSPLNEPMGAVDQGQTIERLSGQGGPARTQQIVPVDRMAESRPEIQDELQPAMALRHGIRPVDEQPRPPPPAAFAGEGTFHADVALAQARRVVRGISDPQILEMAVNAFNKAWSEGDVTRRLLTVIDFSIPANRPRLWVINLENGTVEHRLKVAHGRNSGQLGGAATRFSDVSESNTSSVGAFVIGSYTTVTRFASGKLFLDGLESGFNGNARRRNIVMHGADYVAWGGRSLGCPALESSIAVQVMHRLEGGSMLFAYGNEPTWLRDSEYIR